MVLLTSTGFAQTLYKQTGESYLSISGTSTLHEWTMTSQEGKCQASFQVNADGTPSKLNSLTVSVRSESLKSGHNAMDKNAYSSLNTADHKNIKFELTSAVIIGAKIQCTGNLAVAGVTKPVSVDATYKVMPNHTLLCSGTKKIKMSDFEIDPPSFMFGTVTTGDEITISFNVNLVPVKK